MSKTKFSKNTVVNTFHGLGYIEAIDHDKSGNLRDRCYVVRLYANRQLKALNETEISL
jgi:hypothetical protein